MNKRQVTDTIYIRDSKMSDAIKLGPRLRDADKTEVMLSSCFGPVEALFKSIDHSTYARTAVMDGKPEIMWGVSPHPIDKKSGAIWLLSSERLYDIPRIFLKEAMREVSIIMKQFDTVGNHVHVMNTKSQDWLIGLGFSAEPAAAHGPYQEPFIFFYKE